jgi:hypothetical protein
MARKVAVTGRVDPATKKAIEELAKKDGRSLGQYVERVLLAHLKGKRPERSRRPVSDN